MVLTSCGPEKTRIDLPENFDPKDLTWKTYHKYCGPQNLFNKKNFKKIKGTTVTWKGTVAQVLDDDSSNSYSNKIVRWTKSIHKNFYDGFVYIANHLINSGSR